MQITWITSPISIAFAQNYLSPEVYFPALPMTEPILMSIQLWVPFFNFIQFVTGVSNVCVSWIGALGSLDELQTIFSAKIKKMRLAAAAKQQEKKPRDD